MTTDRRLQPKERSRSGTGISTEARYSLQGGCFPSLNTAPSIKQQQDKRALKQVVSKAKSKARAQPYSLKHCAAFHTNFTLRLLSSC